MSRFCRSCAICQKTIAKGTIPRALHGKMPLIDRPFKKAAVDLIGPIHSPNECGHRFALTLADYVTSYPEAVPLKSVIMEVVAEVLVDIHSRLGIPEEVLTDLGKQFTSKCMSEVSRLLSIKQLTVTPTIKHATA